MHHQHEQCQHCDQNRVPGQNCGLIPEAEVGPQRLEEIAGGVEWNTAHDICESGAKENGQKQTGDGKEKVPERIPHSADDVMAKSDGNPAQDEQPKNYHQRQIEAAEAAGVERRKSKIESATGSDQPHFIAIPNGPDTRQNLASLFVCLRDQQVNCAGAEVKAVEQDIHGNHRSHEAKPECSHIALLSPRPRPPQARYAKLRQTPARPRFRDKRETTTEYPVRYTSP